MKKYENLFNRYVDPMWSPGLEMHTLDCTILGYFDPEAHVCMESCGQQSFYLNSLNRTVTPYNRKRKHGPTMAMVWLCAPTKPTHAGSGQTTICADHTGFMPISNQRLMHESWRQKTKQRIGQKKVVPWHSAGLAGT